MIGQEVPSVILAVERVGVSVGDLHAVRVGAVLAVLSAVVNVLHRASGFAVEERLEDILHEVLEVVGAVVVAHAEDVPLEVPEWRPHDVVLP